MPGKERHTEDQRRFYGNVQYRCTLTQVIRHEVPIAIRALKTANIYEINNGRHILVDTGMSPGSLDFLLDRGVDFSKIELVVLTHLHVDHIGGAQAFRDKYGIPIAIGSNDALRIRKIQEDRDGFGKFLSGELAANGTPSDILSRIVDRHSVLDNMSLYHDIDLDRELKGGEKIGSNIEIISNPGHSPGSISIHIPDTNYLFTGDHLLPGITPNISFYDEESDMLGLYIESLKETLKLHAEKIFPGHRDPFTNGNSRILEILNHHLERLNEILSVSGGWSSAFEVASRIKWSKGRTLDSMNLMEMNFAIGEAISHLRHLYSLGMVEKKEKSGISTFKSSGQALKAL